MEVTVNPDIREPPYLMAIQSLNGQMPKEKYRYLNALIQSLVKICRESGVSSEEVISAKQHEIPVALLPLVRILMGIELKSTKAMVEALKSPDTVVVNKALRAKWFFDGSNSHVDAPYFMENIFPFVSIRTRMDIVKALTRGLYNAGQKAENFFNLFYDMFGLEQATPFLPYCSENFLFETILKFKIVLSIKILDKIFQRYPKLAIRYLYLGCTTYDNNESDRKILTIKLNTYANFLPKLMKKHIIDYINLLPFVSNYCKIGSSRKRALFKYSKYSVAKNMEKYYGKWPLKYIYYSMTKEEFVKYYASLHPESNWNYRFKKMFEYLKYYPKCSRIDFMKNQFERLYKEDFFFNLHRLLDMSELSDLFNNGQINEEQLELLYSKIFPNVHDYNFSIDKVLLNLKNYSNEKMLNMLHKCMKEKFNVDLNEDSDSNSTKYCASEKYLLLLPNEEKLKKAQHLVASCKKRSSSYYKWCCFLAVEQSFDILKFGAESPSAQKRTEFLKKMIYSCNIYNDQTHLTKVLKYYIQRHKNEQSSMLHSILAHLINQFDILALHDTNWHLFCELVKTAYIKQELFNAPLELVNKIFELSLHRLSTQSEEQMQIDEATPLNVMINKYLEFKIVYQDNTDWTIFENMPDLENEFIKLFILYIPINYPESHSIWRKDDKKIKVALQIISKLQKRNQKIINTLKAQGRDESDLNAEITRVTNFTWLRQVSEHILQQSNSKNPTYLESFKALMKNYDEEFYLSVIPNISVNDPHKNILSGKARWILKNNCSLILDCWEEYFTAARNMLNSIQGAQAAKNFIISTKWHQQLPLRFVERCLDEIDEPGSLIILALLVDGETVSKFLSNHIPSEPTVDINKVNAKRNYQIISSFPAAMNVSVPFVSTEIFMSMFQNEYTKLGQRSVKNFAQRVDKPSVVNFAKQLLNKPVSVQKHGIRLMFSVFTSNEIIDFVTESSNSKRHPTINTIMAHRILHLFIKCPNDKTWNIVNNFLDGLRCHDLTAFKVLINTKMICNPYASLYFKKLLDKIEELDEESKKMKTEQETGKENTNTPGWMKDEDASLKGELIKAALENVTQESAMWLSKEIIIDILNKYFFKAESKNVMQASSAFAKKIFSRPFIGRK